MKYLNWISIETFINVFLLYFTSYFRGNIMPDSQIQFVNIRAYHQINESEYQKITKVSFIISHKLLVISIIYIFNSH